MRKFIVIFVMVSLLIIPFTAMAQPDDTGIKLDAKAAVLVDAQSGKILYQKNANEKLPIASVTKVMTLNIIFDNIESGNLSLDDSVTVSENAASMGGSQAFIDAGYSYKVSDLIKSIIIASANDAAVAMAEKVAGSEEAFVVKMNKKAAELGMNDTVFKNCNGLNEEGHLSTAGDVAKMSIELLKHEAYFQWGTVWMDSLQHAKDGRVTELVNTNRLIRTLNGCDGLKTGYTSNAMFCITATAKRNDMRLVSVILGGSTSKARFNDASTLINYGFANYKKHTVVSPYDVVTQLPLAGGTADMAEIVAQKGFSVCVENDSAENITTRLVLPEKINAPVKAGTQIGEMVISLNDEEIGKIPLIVKNDYERAGFFDRLKGIISFWN